MCQGLTRLIVAAAENNTKLLVQGTLDSDGQRQISLAIVALVLVSAHSMLGKGGTATDLSRHRRSSSGQCSLMHAQFIILSF